MSDTEQPSVGARLRERRLEFGMTLEVAAEKTRIRRAYLEALEADRFDVLPGEAYLKGFLRSYAGLLKLDPDALLERFQYGAAEPTTVVQDVVRRRGAAPVRRGRARGGRKRFRVAAVILGVLTALAVALPLLFNRGSEPWASLQAEGRPAAPAPAPIAHRPLPATEPGTPGQSDAPGVGPAVGAPNAPVPAEIAGASAASPLPGSGVPSPTAPAGSPGGSSLMPDHSPPSLTVPAGGAILRLETLGPVRIELTIDNHPPRRYDLKADNSLSWKVGRNARITIGNPAAVRLWLGDLPLEVADRSEIILRGVEEVRREEER